MSLLERNRVGCTISQNIRLYTPCKKYCIANLLIFNTEGKIAELWSHCVASPGLYREYILDFLRVDYASVGECQFTVLECSTVARSYEVTDTL